MERQHNMDYFAQLSSSQKAELFRLYAANGMYNYNDIVSDYNQRMEEKYRPTSDTYEALRKEREAASQDENIDSESPDDNVFSDESEYHFPTLAEYFEGDDDAESRESSLYSGIFNNDNSFSLIADNEYADGGNVKKVINDIKSGARKVGKKIIYDVASAVSSNGGIRRPSDLLITAANLVKNKIHKNSDYDELKLYMYGDNSSGKLTPFDGETHGDKLLQYKNNGAKEYSGVINPDYEYVFPEEKKWLLDEIADRNSNIYINADNYAYKIGENPQRYDAGSNGIRLRRDSSGNILGSAFDVYDFDEYYRKRYKVPKWQVDLMGKLGDPYIVRQEDIPIRFVDKMSKDYKRADRNWESVKIAESDSDYGSGYSDPDFKLLQRAGYGLINESRVTTDAPYWMDRSDILEFKNGGKLKSKK